MDQGEPHYNLRKGQTRSPMQTPKSPTTPRNRKIMKNSPGKLDQENKSDKETDKKSKNESFDENSDNSKLDNSVDSSQLSDTNQDYDKQSKRDQDIEEPSVDHPVNWEYKLKIIFFIAMFAIGITFCWHVVSNAKEAPQEPVARPSFQQFKDDNLKNLMNDFPSQNSKQFWQVLRAAIKRILTEEDPKYPAILLFAVPKDPSASLTGSCLAHHLTHQLNVFHGLENKAFIDIDKDLTHKSAAGDKKELDEKLINLYGVRESKGVAVDHFEKLSPMASLLFHGYCDGDHAPYKNVSMVLVLHTDINQDNILTNKSAVDDFLQNLWAKELDGDKIPPLISRIANNVAIVTPEDEHSIRKLCPWL